jgi:predicted P-loop ATPase
VNGRPIFGRSQEDRVRYASFLATTNDLHPLCDPTGSRRFLCLQIRKGMLIDNTTPINHAQLYAQVLHELREEKVPYWFSNDEVARIQAANLPYLRTDDMEGILHQCFRLPDQEEEGEWLTCKQVSEALQKVYPTMRRGNATNIRIGQTLKYLGCESKHTFRGATYKLIKVAA